MPKATASASPAAIAASAVSLVEALVGDVDAAECLLELRPDAVVAQRLAGADEGETALAELARQIAEGAEPVGIPHRVAIGPRRQVHADPARRPHREHRIGHLQMQARAVLDGSAVGVGALVAAVLQELVEQVAVGAVDLDAVEAGGLGVLRAPAEGLDDGGDLARSPARAGSRKPPAAVSGSRGRRRRWRSAPPAARRRDSANARCGPRARAAAGCARPPRARLW